MSVVRRPALLDFASSLVVGAIPSTITGIGVIGPYPIAAYRGWIGASSRWTASTGIAPLFLVASLWEFLAWKGSASSHVLRQSDDGPNGSLTRVLQLYAPQARRHYRRTVIVLFVLGLALVLAGAFMLLIPTRPQVLA